MVKTLGIIAIVLGFMGTAHASDSLAAKKEVIGVGVNIDIKDGKIMIMALIPNAPAERSKLLAAGDEITGVQSTPQSQLILVTGNKPDDVANLIRGTEGVPCGLQIKRGSSTFMVSIVRAKFEVEEP